MNEVKELFHKIVLITYERALYLKCLNNELIIPSSLIPILKDKGLITEGIELNLQMFIFFFLILQKN
jgi:hypothetical protein